MWPCDHRSSCVTVDAMCMIYMHERSGSQQSICEQWRHTICRGSTIATLAAYYYRGKCDCPRCLSVCLSVSKITEKRVHGFRWHFACRRVSAWTWMNWSTFEPDPDHSPDAGTRLLSSITYALQREFYYVGQIRIGHPSKQRRVVLRRRNTIVGGK